MNPFRKTLGAWRKSVILALDPLRYHQARLAKSPDSPLEERIAYDVFPRPHYAYGVHRAAAQAKALGLPGISAIEFGCAGGNGLLELEKVAAEVGKALGIRVDVYGFDIGEGLPKPLDYRDLPYAWRMEQFKMDIPRLKGRLTSAQLVIGDVHDTVVPFTERQDLLPVGFVAFDLDYYSSTMAAFRIFDGRPDIMLPRVYCYFDDCIGPDNELHSEFVGELLAIKEFNAAHEMMKIAPINGLAHKRIIPAAWNDMMFVMHAFDHPLYGTYIDTGIDMSLALEDSA